MKVITKHSILELTSPICINVKKAQAETMKHWTNRRAFNEKTFYGEKKFDTSYIFRNRSVKFGSAFIHLY